MKNEGIHENLLDYYVLPPEYNYKHFGPDNLPKYLYARSDMDSIQEVLRRAYFEVVEFKVKLRSAANL